MKRFWWLIPTLLVLVGAFFLPGLLLTVKEARMERQVFVSADVTPTWQGSGASLSMGEKLSLMARQDSTVRYDFGVVADDLELRARYNAELDTLAEKKLISGAVREWLTNYKYEITKSVLLDMERGKSLSVYRVQYYDGMTNVLLDAQTYLVLSIMLNAYDTYVVDAEGEMLYIDYHSLDVPQWSEYYGADDGDDYGTWLYMDGTPEDYYLYAQSFSIDGVKLGVSLHYSHVMETLTWSIETEGNVHWLITGEFLETEDNANADAP